MSCSTERTIIRHQLGSGHRERDDSGGRDERGDGNARAALPARWWVLLAAVAAAEGRLARARRPTAVYAPSDPTSQVYSG